MTFEVFSRDGRHMMWTDSPLCVPPDETQRSLKLAGYIIKIDGKKVR